jgi:hypothetical protein
VIDRYLNPGESVEQRPIVKIAQVNPLRVEVVAPVSLLGKIKRGQLAMVTPESPVGGSYEAEVKIVDPILDAASGTFRIRLELPNEDYSLTSGLRCQVGFLDKMASIKPTPAEEIGTELANTATEPVLAMSLKSEPSTASSEVTKREAAEHPRYLVVTSESTLPLKKALRRAETLRQKGVEDTYVIAKGSLKGHISLGYFKYRRIADNYRQQLADLGVETRIVIQ